MAERRANSATAREGDGHLVGSGFGQVPYPLDVITSDIARSLILDPSVKGFTLVGPLVRPVGPDDAEFVSGARIGLGFERGPIRCAIAVAVGYRRGVIVERVERHACAIGQNLACGCVAGLDYIFGQDRAGAQQPSNKRGSKQYARFDMRSSFSCA